MKLYVNVEGVPTFRNVNEVKYEARQPLSLYWLLNANQVSAISMQNIKESIYDHLLIFLPQLGSSGTLRRVQ